LRQTWLLAFLRGQSSSRARGIRRARPVWATLGRTACTSTRLSRVSSLVSGLHRLEYRGYDSAGVAIHDGRHIGVVLAAGKLRQPQNAPTTRTLSGSTENLVPLRRELDARGVKLAHEIADLRGNDVDQPRNLAKTVTVE
jgi:glucosamine 6-phosphate synthetase-like amidotransferase/phosphosugar isomerase protein